MARFAVGAVEALDEVAETLPGIRRQHLYWRSLMTSGPPKRRILLVTNLISWAGAETQLNYLATGLGKAGHSVKLLAIEGVLIDLQGLKDAGVEVVSLNASTRADKLVAALKIVHHARRADVVHCTGWDASLWGRIAAFLARRPMLITEHTPGRNLQVTEGNASRARAIALHNRILDRITYATIAVAAWQIALLENEGVRRESIVRIPNAVPVRDLRRRAESGPTRASLDIPEGAPIVVHLARFVPQKGQLTTLRAVARLRDRIGDIRVLFVGDGPERAIVEREAKGLGADWAVFLGRRDDVPGILRLADLSVLPSRGEGLPMSLIEAMALGTPVVATDVGDVRWLLESTDAGVCVAAGDERAFGEACARVLEDSELRERMAAAGRRAAPDFDAVKMVRRYEQVLEAAIESAPLPLAPPATGQGVGGAMA
jgi:glycosyltransferase involved in cell wall biosynthesis